MKKPIAVLALAILFSTVLFSNEGSTPAVHQAVMNLTKAEAPKIVDGTAIFSADGPAHSVGIAFKHERFANVYPFLTKKAVLGDPNSKTLYVFTYPIPKTLNEAALGYRIIVDGLWITDPKNPAKERDPGTGVSISILQIPAYDPFTPETYVIVRDGVAHFHFSGKAGEIVTVSGDFNGWDPFLQQLEEVSPGVYEISIALTPGNHYYCFIYQGQRIFDPLNSNKLWDSHGRPVNMLVVE